MRSPRPGSSPCGRGKHTARAALVFFPRLIPVRAGKTTPCPAARADGRAHPRAGGGKRCRCRGRSHLRRLIPARAGKTSAVSTMSLMPRAHPRAGGENNGAVSLTLSQYGSSPHGRGKPAVAGSGSGVAGLIPAWAGKTSRAFCQAFDAVGSSPHGRGKRSRSESSPPTKAAHPRMGGENLCYKQVTLVSLGSSPHARGKLNGRVDGNLAPGLIPAWAGKTTRSMSAWIIEAAHPRMGGENFREALVCAVEFGSSPHGRGKPIAASEFEIMRRLIPAWAGKTYRGRTGVRPFTAHPRMGGENLCSSVAVVGVEGSSPHGRGKHLGVIPGQAGHRLIPAWAGKTCRKLRRERAAAAHPRAGGENSTVERLSLSYSGSSPRGRGKPASALEITVLLRLIPARAGKTASRSYRGRSSWAHPRAGGENFATLACAGVSGGSSPRGRGKRGQTYCRASMLGLIPARAGKTAGRLYTSQTRRAHPRAGGENRARGILNAGMSGSSPRGRGKQPARSEGSGGRRLIPARAGKTWRALCLARSLRAHPRAGGENLQALLNSGLFAGSSPRGRGKPHHELSN